MQMAAEALVPVFYPKNTSILQEEDNSNLRNIQSGNFAKEFMSDCDSGGNKMNQFRKDSAEHSIESVGEELRSMMPWITANKIVDKTKS